MLAKLRQFVIAVIFGVLGAVVGRLVSDFRRQQAAGEPPSPPNLDGIDIKPQDVVPGIVAAMRVTSRPWSWFHIPPWLAAFAVNFCVVAFAGELRSIERMGRDALGGMTGDMTGDMTGETAGGGEDGEVDGAEWGATEPATAVEQGTDATATGAPETSPRGNGAGALDS